MQLHDLNISLSFLCLKWMLTLYILKTIFVYQKKSNIKLRSPVTKKTHLYPFIVTALTVIFDQLTKYLVIKSIPLGGVGFTMLNDFFRIIHVRNLGMAFSMGHDLSTNLRMLGLILLPLVVMAIVVVYFFKTEELNLFQRYILCGISA
jgi:signal peptidase II